MESKTALIPGRPRRRAVEIPALRMLGDLEQYVLVRRRIENHGQIQIVAGSCQQDPPSGARESSVCRGVFERPHETARLVFTAQMESRCTAATTKSIRPASLRRNRGCIGQDIHFDALQMRSFGSAPPTCRSLGAAPPPYRRRALRVYRAARVILEPSHPSQRPHAACAMSSILSRPLLAVVWKARAAQITRFEKAFR